MINMNACAYRLLLVCLFGVSSCTQSGVQDGRFATKSSECLAFDTSLRATQYSARLVAPGERDLHEKYELQIQAIHPGSMASPIIKITLNDRSTPAFRFHSDDCICDMEVRSVDVDCTHITAYIAYISRNTLTGLIEKGLAMTFALENGRIVAGPRISSAEIKRVLARS